MLEEADYLKMKYVLSEPAGCSMFRMTRPIEKVERRNTLQISFLVFDILNFLVFGVFAVLRTRNYVKSDTSYKVLEAFAILCTLAFISTALFYILTLSNPGYVPK
jgi:hypothetical protein